MPNTKEDNRIRGHFVFTTYDADGNKVNEGRGDNTMCAVGLTTLAQVINYFGVLDQNSNMGNPFVYQDLTPIYGAIGTGATTPTDSDTQLTSEVAAPNGRNIVYAGGTSPASGGGTDATWTWNFFFGIPSGSIVIAECGVFVNATSTINSGTLLDHSLITPAVTQTTAETATLSITFSIGTV